MTQDERALTTPLAWDAPLADYDAQARFLLDAFHAGDARALEVFHNNLPRFLDDTVLWLPKRISDAEIRSASLTPDDARLVVARVYGYQDWSSLTDVVTAIAGVTSPVHEFERAVEAVVDGDVTTLQALLHARPALITARSTRVTCQDPPVHGATLLHYVASNGVENVRQRSPANAVDVARLLLESGAVVDALAGMYGAQCTTLSMLVSSSPPADRCVQVPLTHLLLDYGANPDGAGVGAWSSPLLTALVFGFRDAAEALAARGASVDDLVKAAGLGRVATCVTMLPSSTADERHRALALAATVGHADVVQLLVEDGTDPNRLNPDGFHSHSTPLHQAVAAGHLAVVQYLIAHGARTDIRDTLWDGSALGWAEHCNQPAVAECLRAAGAV